MTPRVPSPSLRSQLLVIAVGGFFAGHLLNGVLAYLFRRFQVGEAIAAHVAFLVFFVLLGGVAVLSVHITRPLGRLTAAAEAFSGLEKLEPLTLDGPPDVRRALQAFNVMGERISYLLSEKDQMLGALGHDLRTPLTSLRIRAESMRPVQERQAVFATLDGMERMIDDILTLARTGHTSERATEVDVAQLLVAIAQDFRAQNANVTIAPAPSIPWALRPDLVGRAIRNLVDNAIRYGGRARLGAVVRADRLIITVDDDGPGVPLEKIDEILEPFARLDHSRNRRTGGTGLGLAIAKSIAHLHGGALELRNREEGGLRATLILPRSTGTPV